MKNFENKAMNVEEMEMVNGGSLWDTIQQFTTFKPLPTFKPSVPIIPWDTPIVIPDSKEHLIISKVD